jgi:hypothetical protein
MIGLAADEGAVRRVVSYAATRGLQSCFRLWAFNRQEGARMARGETFDADAFEMVSAAVQVGDVISTLGISRPNWIAGIGEDGIYVETVRSKQLGRGPQLVPAWMINVAWAHLRKHRRLTQEQLLNELNVKRSAFVCALLSRFEGVEVESDKPVVLRLVAGGERA